MLVGIGSECALLMFSDLIEDLCIYFFVSLFVAVGCWSLSLVYTMDNICIFYYSRYDRKQQGFGGQSKPILRKKAKTTKKLVGPQAGVH